jgi:HAD superfamily hydrolase (TIGR01509 family)
MNNLSENKSIIFDLDGTIWNSIPYRIKAWQLAFKDFGIDTDSEVIRLMIGYPGSMLIKKMNSRDPAIEQREEMYFEQMLPDVQFYPDVAKTFSELRKSGFKIAIVTSSRRDLIEKINVPADAIVTMDDVQKGKPDPEPYEKAIKIMGGIPDRTIVVGDIDNDLVPAKLLGCVAILVSHGTQKQSEHKDYEISEIWDVINIIQNLNWK